jgi:hypothetical protein
MPTAETLINTHRRLLKAATEATDPTRATSQLWSYESYMQDHVCDFVDHGDHASADKVALYLLQVWDASPDHGPEDELQEDRKEYKR